MSVDAAEHADFLEDEPAVLGAMLKQTLCTERNLCHLILLVHSYIKGIVTYHG
jgi:hypothetical protein